MSSTPVIRVSPSQIKTFKDCPRKWAYDKIDCWRTPSTASQQFGTDTHEHLENWLLSGVVPPDTPTGKVASQGLTTGWLPEPELKRDGRTYDVEVELFVDPKITVKGSPVYIIGRIDLLEYFELGVRVTDHKTSSNMSYAMTDDQLAEDPQALAYAGYGIVGLGHKVAEAQWLYYAYSKTTQRPAGTKRTAFTFEAESEVFKRGWNDILETATKIAETKLGYTQAVDVEGDEGGCRKFGGCGYAGKCPTGLLTLSRKSTNLAQRVATGRKEEDKVDFNARLKKMKEQTAAGKNPLAKEVIEEGEKELKVEAETKPEPKPKSKTKTKAKPKPKTQTQKVNPPEGDEPKKERAGVLVVAFDCAFVKGGQGATYHLIDILRPIMDEIAKKAKVPHWTKAGHYVEARGELQRRLKEELESGNYDGIVLASTASSDTAAVHDILIESATAVIQSFK